MVNNYVPVRYHLTKRVKRRVCRREAIEHWKRNYNTNSGEEVNKGEDEIKKQESKIRVNEIEA